MARKPRQQRNGHGDEEGVESVRHAVGGNVTQETVRRHYGAIDSAEAGLKRAQQKLKTCWDDAEAAGIDKKALKSVMKRLKEDPATARLHMNLVRSYSVQLGLFDKIEGWLQDEERGAQAASIDRAEGDTGSATI